MKLYVLSLVWFGSWTKHFNFSDYLNAAAKVKKKKNNKHTFKEPLG